MCAQSAQIVATTKGILYSPWAGRLLVFPCQAEAVRLHGLAEAWLVCLVCHSAAGSCVVIWSSDVLSRHVFEGRGRSDTSRQQKSQELKVELIKLSRKLQLAESLLLSSGAREEGLPEARVLAYRAVGPSLRVVTRRQGDLASTQAGFSPFQEHVTTATTELQKFGAGCLYWSTSTPKIPCPVTAAEGCRRLTTRLKTACWPKRACLSSGFSGRPGASRDC